MTTLGYSSQHELALLLKKTLHIQRELAVLQKNFDILHSKAKQAGFDSSVAPQDWRKTQSYWAHQQDLLNQINRRLNLCHSVLCKKLGFHQEEPNYSCTSSDDVISHLSNPIVQSSVIQLVVNEINDLSEIPIFGNIEAIPS